MLGALALQNSVDVRKDRVEPLLTNDLDNRLADQIGRATTEHLRIGFADEAISQIAPAPYEHERSSVDNSFQFCSVSPQHVLDTPAVGEVHQHVHRAKHGTGGVEYRRRTRNHPNPGAVGSLRNRLYASDRPYRWQPAWRRAPPGIDVRSRADRLLLEVRRSNRG